MNFCPPRLFTSLAFGAALAICPAGAQEAIQYSNPAGPNSTDKSAAQPEATPAPTSGRRLSVDDYKAPPTIFNLGQSANSFDLLPGSPGARTVSPTESKRWQQLLDNRKNWALQTPAELLGLTTTTEILGLSKPNSDRNLSADQRFLQRLDLDRRAAAVGTNSFRQPENFLRDNRTRSLFHPEDPSVNTSLSDGEINPNSPRSLKQLFSVRPDSLFSPPDPKPDGAFGSPFGFTPAAAKPTARQLADMQQFRELLEPSSAPDKPVAASRFSPPTAASRDSIFDSSAKANPAARSFAPLASSMSRPVGLRPLTGITGPNDPPTGKSRTGAQLPPWLSDSPSPFTMPQRKF